MRAEQRSGSLMAAPYTAFLLIFALYPILFALALVFMKWDLVTTPSFAGFDNVQMLANDGRFWRAVANTFVFLSIHLPLQIATALALALALNRPLAFLSFWRAAFFLPVVISGAVVAILWSNLYATDVGLINGVLVRLGWSPVPWLTDPSTAMPAIAAMVTWKNVGFYVIIYLAGLQYIPRSCKEAIEIEGATSWQRFRYLTLPSLLPQTILVVTLSTINGFQLFIEPYVMTGGGPLRRTYSIVLYLYTNAFAYQKMGYAATIGVALALIIGGVVFVQRRLIGKAEADMKIFKRIALYGVLAVAALTFIYPFLWMAAATFKPRGEFGSLSLFSANATFDNYRTMWERAPFGRALLNSMLVAGTITLSVLVFGSITAYAMARLRFRGSPWLNAATMGVLLIPGQLTLIPMYTLIVQVGLIDTYAALILPYLFNATAILMMRQFFLQIPQSLIDSARMDGMGEMRILFTIFWPLSKPVLSIVAIFTFMGSWNEVLWPLLVVREQHLMTLPQLLTVFTLGGGAGSVGASLASAMVLVIPVVIAYAILQRNFIESMAGSGVKG